MMDDPKTKIEPLTPEQAAWYAEQEAKCHKAKKLAVICETVSPIICLGLMVLFRIIFSWLKSQVGDCQNINDGVKFTTFFFGGLAICSILVFALNWFAAEKKLEKLQRERLFREK
ncbi:MAG: hypothetical protein J5898_06085 [Lachnospiraceae bacterium]|nr:hypothetical protein [Lachnospiraceae bacterium]MBO4631174.1 hypothetical protein [Lentisphaeria bacterium]